MAFVRFTQTEYRVEESVGSIDLFVMITNQDGLIECTYDFDFWISVSTHAATAS